MKRRYRSYTAKKYKLPKRILFFAVCAVVIFIFALILGNHLKARMENADINREPIETQDVEQPDVPDITENGNAAHPESKATVKAGYLQLAQITDTKDIHNRIDALKTNGFNAVSFAAVENGRLTYASRTIEEYSRLPVSENVISFENITESVAYAHTKKMTASAIVIKGNDEVLDAMICAELSEIGFDEIIISGFESLLTENGGESLPCIKYIKNMRTSASSSQISLSLAPSAFTYARNSYQIEKLFSYTEFLTIDMTNIDITTATELCENISGSFSAYMLRPLVKGDATDITSMLNEKGITTIQFISPIPSPEPDTTDTETTTNN